MTPRTCLRSIFYSGRFVQLPPHQNFSAKNIRNMFACVYRASAMPLLVPPTPTPRHTVDTTNDITNALQYNGNYAQLWKLFPLFISHTATAATQQKRARHLSSFVQTQCTEPASAHANLCVSARTNACMHKACIHTVRALRSRSTRMRPKYRQCERERIFCVRPHDQTGKRVCAFASPV